MGRGESRPFSPPTYARSPVFPVYSVLRVKLSSSASGLHRQTKEKGRRTKRRKKTLIREKRAARWSKGERGAAARGKA